MNDQEGNDRKTLPRLWLPGQAPPKEVSSCNIGSPDTEITESHAIRAAHLSEEWKRTPSFENAISLVEAASCLSEKLIAYSAAEQILKTPSAKTLAKRLAASVYNAHHSKSLPFQSISPPIGLRAGVAHTRKRLHESPRNPHLWCELGRLHTFLGNTSSAKQAFETAIHLAPNDRFALRSFARFAAHAPTSRNDADAGQEALWHLRRAERLRFDPWIQATEIALSDLLHEVPTSIRFGQRSLTDKKQDDFSLSEVASALGTFEIVHGSKKKAERLIATSLSDPTANALAQAAWLSSQEKVKVNAKFEMLGITAVNEAAAYEAVKQEKWEKAIEHIARWQMEEPFSVNAAAQGSFLAVSTTFDSQKAISFCSEGLKTNHSSKVLLNNLTVAYGLDGNISEARKTFDQLVKHNPKWEAEVTTCATGGLLGLLEGDVSGAERLYCKAIDRADETGEANLRFRARAHWLYELSTRDLAPSHLVEPAIDALEKFLARSNIPASTKQSWKIMKSRILEHNSRSALMDEVDRRLRDGASLSTLFRVVE